MHFKIFPSLFEKPQKIRFEMQEEQEVIELFLRRHPITNVPWILISLIAFSLPFVLIQLDQYLSTNIFLQIPTQILVGGLIIFFMIILAFILESFLFWYFNVDIVTNQHVIDVDFISLLSREIVEAGLDDIELVTRKMSGVWDALFNYGDVLIETSAERTKIIFESVPNPDFVVDRIQDLISARKLFFESGD